VHYKRTMRSVGFSLASQPPSVSALGNADPKIGEAL